VRRGSIFAEILLPGEKLIWTAQPNRSARFSAALVLRLAIAIGLLVWSLPRLFSIANSFLAFGVDPFPWQFVLNDKSVLLRIALTFGGVSLLMADATKFFKKTKTYYALSARRAFVASAQRGASFLWAADIQSGGDVRIDRQGHLKTLTFPIYNQEDETGAGMVFADLSATECREALSIINSSIVGK
jgi:hypothetical protein